MAATQPKHKAVLCLVERHRAALDRIDLPPLEAVLACELGIPNFESFVFRHRVVEACCAVKAQMLLWSIQNFPDEQYFLYLDADIYAYSRFVELERVFPHINVLVTPHHLHDEERLDGIRDHMIRSLMCGIYNSGFLAIHRSPLSLEFLRWWNKKLLLMCYSDFSRGLYNEQKWIDMAFSFFDINIFREPGYNVANWNVGKRCVRKGGSPGQYLVSGKPLRFFHFSMIDSGRDMAYFNKDLEPESPVFEMRSEYLKMLASVDRSELSHKDWTYNYFFSGEPISDRTRFAYREGALECVEKLREPFGESNATMLSCAATHPTEGANVTRGIRSLFARRRKRPKKAPSRKLDCE